MLEDRRVLFVRADRINVADETVRAAREMIEKLGLDLRVKVIYSKTLMRGNIYDHYFDRSWRR